MLRKIAWTALVTVTSTLAATLAARASRELWRRMAKSEPPESSGFVKLLVGKPLRRGTQRRFAHGVATP